MRILQKLIGRAIRISWVSGTFIFGVFSNTPVSGDSSEPENQELEGVPSSLQQEELPGWATKYPSEAVVGRENVPVYRGPSFHGQPLLRLKKGTKIQVMDKARDQFPLDASSRIGPTYSVKYAVQYAKAFSGVGYMKAEDLILKSTKITSPNKNYTVYFNNINGGWREISGMFIPTFSLWMFTKDGQIIELGKIVTLPDRLTNHETIIWSKGSEYFYSYTDHSIYSSKTGKLLLESFVYYCDRESEAGKEILEFVHPRWISDHEIILRNNSFWDDGIYKFDCRTQRLTKIYGLEGKHLDYGSGDYAIQVSLPMVDEKAKTIRVRFCRGFDVGGKAGAYYDVMVDFEGKEIKKEKLDVNGRPLR